MAAYDHAANLSLEERSRSSGNDNIDPQGLGDIAFLDSVPPRIGDAGSFKPATVSNAAFMGLGRPAAGREGAGAGRQPVGVGKTANGGNALLSLLLIPLPRSGDSRPSGATTASAPAAAPNSASVASSAGVVAAAATTAAAAASSSPHSAASSPSEEEAARPSRKRRRAEPAAGGADSESSAAASSSSSGESKGGAVAPFLATAAPSLATAAPSPSSPDDGASEPTAPDQAPGAPAASPLAQSGEEALISSAAQTIAAVASLKKGARGRYFGSRAADGIRCYRCKEAGHTAMTCPNTSVRETCFLCAGEAHGRGGGGHGGCTAEPCFVCDAPGHHAVDCPVKRDLQRAAEAAVGGVPPGYGRRIVMSLGPASAAERRWGNRPDWEQEGRRGRRSETQRREEEEARGGGRRDQGRRRDGAEKRGEGSDDGGSDDDDDSSSSDGGDRGRGGSASASAPRSRGTQRPHEASIFHLHVCNLCGGELRDHGAGPSGASAAQQRRSNGNSSGGSGTPCACPLAARDLGRVHCAVCGRLGHAYCGMAVGAAALDASHAAAAAGAAAGGPAEAGAAVVAPHPSSACSSPAAAGKAPTATAAGTHGHDRDCPVAPGHHHSPGSGAPPPPRPGAPRLRAVEDPPLPWEVLLSPLAGCIIHGNLAATTAAAAAKTATIGEPSSAATGAVACCPSRALSLAVGTTALPEVRRARMPSHLMTPQEAAETATALSAAAVAALRGKARRGSLPSFSSSSLALQRHQQAVLQRQQTALLASAAPRGSGTAGVAGRSVPAPTGTCFNCGSGGHAGDACTLPRHVLVMGGGGDPANTDEAVRLAEEHWEQGQIDEKRAGAGGTRASERGRRERRDRGERGDRSRGASLGGGTRQGGAAGGDSSSIEEMSASDAEEADNGSIIEVFEGEEGGGGGDRGKRGRRDDGPRRSDHPPAERTYGGSSSGKSSGAPSSTPRPNAPTSAADARNAGPYYRGGDGGGGRDIGRERGQRERDPRDRGAHDSRDRGGGSGRDRGTYNPRDRDDDPREYRPSSDRGGGRGGPRDDERGDRQRDFGGGRDGAARDDERGFGGGRDGEARGSNRTSAGGGGDGGRGGDRRGDAPPAPVVVSLRRASLGAPLTRVVERSIGPSTASIGPPAAAGQRGTPGPNAGNGKGSGHGRDAGVSGGGGSGTDEGGSGGRFSRWGDAPAASPAAAGPAGGWFSSGNSGGGAGGGVASRPSVPVSSSSASFASPPGLQQLPLQPQQRLCFRCGTAGHVSSACTENRVSLGGGRESTAAAAAAAAVAAPRGAYGSPTPGPSGGGAPGSRPSVLGKRPEAQVFTPPSPQGGAAAVGERGGSDSAPKRQRTEGGPAPPARAQQQQGQPKRQQQPSAPPSRGGGAARAAKEAHDDDAADGSDDGSDAGGGGKRGGGDGSQQSPAYWTLPGVPASGLAARTRLLADTSMSKQAKKAAKRRLRKTALEAAAAAR